MGTQKRICASNTLVSSGAGQRFVLKAGAERFPAFVIRHKQEVFAYINECRHMCLELDWNPGLFFDLDGDYLICATHGAKYQPGTGLCISGPCIGESLNAIEIIDDGSDIYLTDANLEAEAEF